MRALIGLFAAAMLLSAGGCSKQNDASTAPADQQPMPASPTTPADTPPATPESTPGPGETMPPADTTTPSDTTPPSDTTTSPNP